MQHAIAHPTCAPWCVYCTPADKAMLDEGTCFSTELRTALAVPQSDPDDLPVDVADYVTVYAQRNDGTTDVIAVGHGEQMPVYLTPGEAREVIANLQLLLGQLEATS